MNSLIRVAFILEDELHSGLSDASRVTCRTHATVSLAKCCVARIVNETQRGSEQGFAAGVTTEVQHIEFTDFPLDEIKFYFTDNSPAVGILTAAPRRFGRRERFAPH